ncbi:MAG: ornithine cyclodeaminase family protein [Emcibacteraceae bacterium]
MKYFGAEELSCLLPYDELIRALRDGFKQGGEVPLRHSHQITTKRGTENSLLLMPCWQRGGMMGLKMVMVCPENHQIGLESVQSTYILSDATTGEVKAIMNGDELTARRTACASALASSLLSNPKSESLLMMGTGKIASHLIRAHQKVRELKNIYIWGRRFEQAEKLAQKLSINPSVNIEAVNNPEKYADISDIISCATLAREPILKGKWLIENKHRHIDLVGGYTYDMREADNDIIASSNIYVDTFDGALSEAGDILQPIDQGIITKNDVKDDLFGMVKDTFKPDYTKSNTLFKSVGTALEDLIAAKLAYQKTNLK